MTQNIAHAASGGKYLYCIISYGGNFDYGSDLPVQSRLDQRGLQAKQAYVVQYRDIAAVVSDLTNNDIGSIRSGIKGSRQDGMDYILSHQRIVEAYRSAGFIVLPVRFGTVLVQKNLQKLLTTEYSRYKQKISQFINKDEFGVRILIGTQTEQLISMYLHREPDVRTVSEQVQSQSAKQGITYFAKIRLNDLTRSKRLQLVERAKISIHQRLMELADSTATLTKDTSDTLLNRAYLVDRSRADGFVALVRSITNGESNPLGLNVHVSGPWAPYSFCVDPSSQSEDTEKTRRFGTQPRSVQPRYRLVKSTTRGVTAT